MITVRFNNQFITFLCGLDYSSHSSNILDLSREEINNADYINQLLDEVFETLIEKIAIDNDLILRLLNNNITKSSLFLLLTGLKKLPDNNWKEYPLNEKYKFSDILNSNGFTTCKSTKDKSIDKLLKDNNIIYVDSDLLRITIGNEYFDKILLDNDFKKYEIAQKSSDYPYIHGLKDSIYSKINLTHNSLSEKSIISVKDEINTGSTNKYYFYDINHFLTLPNFSIKDYMNSDMYTLNIVYELDRANLSFLNKKTFLTLQELVYKPNFDNLFVFPFIYFENGIIEVSNDAIFDIYKIKNISNKKEIAHTYNDIKKEVINIAKNNYPVWYEEYQRGLNLKPIDLSTLDKIHKPAG